MKILSLFILFLTCKVYAEDFEIMYYGNPGIKWSVQLPDTGTGFQSQLASGNAVQVSPDNLLVYTTLDDGRLEILVASNGKRRWGNTPTPVDASAGWTVKSQSGVYFGNSATLGLFAVYAIIDVAPAGTGLDDRSRVVAVSHPQNNLLWVSDSVPGQIQGTPIVTRDGKYIFFTHNENVSSDAPFGSFSMVHAEDNGKLLFTEVAGSSSDDPVPTRVETLLQPYGPLGVAHSPTEGRYLAGFTNSNDVFIWSTSTSEGKDPNGYTRAFQIPPFFSPPFAPGLQTSFLREVRWNSIAPPDLSSDGQNLVFGIRFNGVRGWTGATDFDQGGNLVQTLAPDPIEARIPIQKMPIFSASETMIYISSSVGIFYGLESSSGNILFSFEGDGSPFSAGAKSAPDDFLVYTTQENGQLSALRQSDGVEFWSLSCSDFSDPEFAVCTDDLKAEFSVSPSGLVLYYGDRFGNIRAIQIGEALGVSTISPTEFPTASPTAAPTPVDTLTPSSSPSMAPSASPSARPSITASLSPSVSTPYPSAAPTLEKSEEPTQVPTAPLTPGPTAAPTTSAPAGSPEDGSIQPALTTAVGAIIALIVFM